MRKILAVILRILAKRTLARYKPIVIGITGSVGKTTAKEAVYAVLRKNYFVWKSSGNFNNEIGVPLAVLGIVPGSGKMTLVLKILKAAWHAYGERRPLYPRYLVLELAADRPGDIGYLTEMTKPKIGIVTAIGEIPVHVENYTGPQDVAEEKSKLISSLPADGLAVLSADDPVVFAMGSHCHAPVVSFGFSVSSSLRASDVSYTVDGKDRVEGITFRLHRGESFLPLRVPSLIATHQIYGVLAAIAVGIHVGTNLVDIADALERIEIPRGRMALVPGIRNSSIIDDSYNASPLSMHAALDTLKQFPSFAKASEGRPGRKVAILGEMAELGRYAEEEHRKADEYAKQCADVVLWCTTSDEILGKVQGMIQEGDVVLVKGSRVAKMEKIVEILAAPTGFEPVFGG